jgi:MFS family permease
MIVALLAVMAVQGYAVAINGAAAAFYAVDFGLDDSGMARTFGWIACGSLGTVFLGRLIDRVGRRSLLLISVAGLSLTALAIATAPTLAIFIAAQIALSVFVGTLLATGTVIIAEEMTLEQRARGQSLMGVVGALGSGLALISVAIVVERLASWRWAWAAVAATILILPVLRRRSAETVRYRAVAQTGGPPRGRLLELFEGTYRRRSIGVMLALFLSQIAATATMSWTLYYPERHLELSPTVATMVILVGGGVGLAGFPIGARLADRLGRRGTVLLCGLLAIAANVAYYWVPADLAPSPVIALAALFCVGTLMLNATTVAFRAAATELFPTRLRGTLQGVLMALAAFSMVLTQFATAILTEALGGMVPAISVLALAGVPGFLLFFLLVTETAGLELDDPDLIMGG